MNANDLWVGRGSTNQSNLPRFPPLQQPTKISRVIHVTCQAEEHPTPHFCLVPIKAWGTRESETSCTTFKLAAVGEPTSFALRCIDPTVKNRGHQGAEKRGQARMNGGRGCCLQPQEMQKPRGFQRNRVHLDVLERNQ
jgi:hypothetical protein